MKASTVNEFELFCVAGKDPDEIQTDFHAGRADAH